MSDFVKVTENKQFLTGAQKAAILLGELGTEVSKQILSLLKLSSDMYYKINVAMASLGSFDSQNKFQVQRELSVLNEVFSFGKAKGIWKTLPEEKVSESSSEAKLQKISDSAATELIAEKIRGWLNEKDN